MRSFNLLGQVFILCIITVCAVSPAVKAGITRVGNRKYTSSKGYRSYTKVNGYDANGFGYNLTVGAIIGDVYNYNKKNRKTQ